MPATESPALPMDPINGRRDDLGALGSQRLGQFGHVLTNEHRLVIEDETIATELLFSVFYRDIDQPPASQEVGDSIYERLSTDDCQPRARCGKDTIRMQKMVVEGNLVDSIIVSEELL